MCTNRLLDQFERNLGDRIASFPRYVRHDAVAYPRIEHWLLEAERLNQFS